MLLTHPCVAYRFFAGTVDGAIGWLKGRPQIAPMAPTLSASSAKASAPTTTVCIQEVPAHATAETGPLGKIPALLELPAPQQRWAPDSEEKKLAGITFIDGGGVASASSYTTVGVVRTDAAGSTTKEARGGKRGTVETVETPSSLPPHQHHHFVAAALKDDKTLTNLTRKKPRGEERTRSRPRRAPSPLPSRPSLIQATQLPYRP